MKTRQTARESQSKFLIPVFCVLFTCALAAPRARAQAPTHVPAACTGIQNELNGLISERNGIQEELKSAAPGEKPNLAGQVKALLPKIAAKEKALDTCAKANGGKADLNTTFTGNATMTTNNAKVAGPFVQGVTIKAYFPHWLHDHINVTSFPTIKVGPFPTPIGDNTTTVTMVDAGSGPVDPATGKVEITVKLHFHHSLALAADSDMTITVSTETAGGSRLAANGAITLVGNAPFDGGYLGGSTCKLVVKGTLGPKP
jgi:hypothetical protein